VVDCVVPLELVFILILNPELNDLEPNRAKTYYIAFLQLHQIILIIIFSCRLGVFCSYKLTSRVGHPRHIAPGELSVILLIFSPHVGGMIYPIYSIYICNREKVLAVCLIRGLK